MDKKYLKTHPWITFSIDTSQAPLPVWMLLGEAQSKCQHIAGTLLDPEIAHDLHTVYLAKGALATTAIEGNTLSESQVRALLDGKLELPRSKEYLGIEVDNIIKACNKILKEQITAGRTTLCVDEIRDFNLKVLADLELGEGVIAGEIRHYSVGVGGYRGAPAEDCPYLLERLCGMLEGDFSLGARWPYATAILKAVIAHLYIAWIHPFGDGNGRTARLIEFKICIASGIPAPAAHLLSNHYNETRTAYYHALSDTSRNNTPFPFIEYALQGYVDQLDEQIKVIRKAQCKAFWTNFIHKKLRKESPSVLRKRQLILDISDKIFSSLNVSEMAFTTDEWLDTSDIIGVSARIGVQYAGKSPRTLARDVSELVEEGFLEKAGSKIRPRFEILSAFIPNRVGTDTH